MNPTTPIIERAFQLARSGRHADTRAVRKALTHEGYTAVEQMHITPTLAKQIRQVCKAAGG
jgi:hypothetical protein